MLQHVSIKILMQCHFRALLKEKNIFLLELLYFFHIYPKDYCLYFISASRKHSEYEMGGGCKL